MGRTKLQESLTPRLNLAIAVIVAIAVGIVAYQLMVSIAAGSFASAEAETGAKSPAVTVDDPSASGGKTLQFGTAQSGGNTGGGTGGGGTTPPTADGVPTVTYDTAEAPDLAGYVDSKVKPTITKWYPEIVKAIVKGAYEPAKSFKVVFDKEFKGTAEARDCNQIVVNPEYARKNPSDIGMYVHESTQIIQCYKSPEFSPLLFSEGIAEWARSYVMKDRTPAKPTAMQSFSDGYAPSAYFLDWISKQYNKPNLVADLNKALHSLDSKYHYEDQLAELVGASQIQQLWFEMTGRKIGAGIGLQNHVIDTRGKSFCVDVTNYNTVNGNQLQLYDCVNSTAQQWVHIYKDGKGGLGQFKTLGKCLDLDGSKNVSGTKIQIWDCNDSPGQLWRQEANGTLKNPHTGKCLDPAGGKVQRGTKLILWDCHSQPFQKWVIPKY